MNLKNFNKIARPISYTLLASLLTTLATFQMPAYGQASMVPEDNAELRALFEGEWQEEFNTWGRWG